MTQSPQFPSTVGAAHPTKVFKSDEQEGQQISQEPINSHYSPGDDIFSNPIVNSTHVSSSSQYPTYFEHASTVNQPLLHSANTQIQCSVNPNSESANTTVLQPFLCMNSIILPDNNNFQLPRSQNFSLPVSNVSSQKANQNYFELPQNYDNATEQPLGVANNVSMFPIQAGQIYIHN